jgi:hypothetical protein
MSRQLQCFRLDYRVTNYSVTPVLVKLKGGLSYIVQRADETTFQNERFLYVTLSNVQLKQLMINESEALTKLDREILRQLAEKKREIEDKGSLIFKDMAQDLEVKIPLGGHLVERNQGIHSELLGFTLYPDASDLNRPALNTPEQTHQDLAAELTDPDEMYPTFYMIYINDPKRVTKPFYINLGGKAVEVPVAFNSSRPAGLYTTLKNSKESPVKQYYPFEDLADKFLESVGVFKSRQLAVENGNTERYLNAEQRVKESATENKKLRDSNEAYVDTLRKTEERLVRTTLDLQRVTETHANEIKLMKNNERLSLDMMKHEARIKDVVQKANFDYVKQRSDSSNWGELAKAVGTLAGIAFTGYKLLSS